ncbi:MAG: exodeoxyribonuclease III [Deltaproteobacteria bacterium]|nr:exodeoxyribonuclease III [Deltaproteobacteria bacterium]
MRIVSWNVNGLRAVQKRGQLSWAFAGDVDVLCLQETKLQADAVTDEMQRPSGFRSWWGFGKKKGYSGTAVFVRDALAAEPFPFSVGGAAHPEFDHEGRVVGVDLGELVLLNVYFPNGGSGPERLAFKHAWHDAFLDRLVGLAKKRSVVVCGDVNVAHRALDVALPEQWADISGFLPEERAWFDRLLAAGFVDTFRAEKGDLPRQFTFWETRARARETNQGWRIDYLVVSRDLEEKLIDAWIWPQIEGSDHCPVGAELEVASRAASPTAPDRAARDDEDSDEDEDDRPRRR